MLISNGRVEDLLGNEETADVAGFTLTWRGFVYVPGLPPGLTSLAACNWDGIDAVRRAAGRLDGSFALSVASRTDGRHWVVTGGMMDAFAAGGTVSTSFLRLCDASGVRFSDLDPEAVAELVDLGYVLGRRTLVKSIERLVPGKIYELPAGGGLVQHEGVATGIDLPPRPGLTIEGWFRELSSSLRGLRVSADLTGGSDSRLVAALLDPDLDVEFATTGRPGNTDIEIAGRVARTLGRPLEVLEHDAGDLGSEIGELFDATDGLCDPLAYHRPFQNALARRSRGVQVALSGAGGELYKDFWWLQDFPRYRSSRSNVERLLDLRVRPVGVPAGLLSGEFAVAAAGIRERMVRMFTERAMPLNTQTYDRIYYELKMSTTAARYTSMNSLYVPFITPLLSDGLVRLGYRLPRRDRFFSRFHRRVVSRAAPAVAALPTTEGGASLSSSRVRQVADLVPYVGEKARRLVGKVRQRTSGAALLQESPDDPGLVAAARRLPAFTASVDLLRERGVLAPGREVPDAYVGRVLALGLLAERLRDV